MEARVLVHKSPLKNYEDSYNVNAYDIQTANKPAYVDMLSSDYPAVVHE